MRRTVRCLILFFGVIMIFTLFGCGKQKHELHFDRECFRVTFINNVETADVWVLPQTDDNLKSSLWGTASAKSLEVNTQRDITLSKTDESELYIVNIIDADHAYYSAQNIRLDDGYVIRFTTEDSKYDAYIEVLNTDGAVLMKQEAFVGVFGAE